MKRKPDKEMRDTMSRNPNNWKGILYVNSKDPRLIVPKINPSLGWTLNFGNIYACVGLGAIILIILVSQLFL